jgi:uncharacterized protein with PIN domain
MNIRTTPLNLALLLIFLAPLLLCSCETGKCDPIILTQNQTIIRETVIEHNNTIIQYVNVSEPVTQIKAKLTQTIARLSYCNDRLAEFQASNNTQYAENVSLELYQCELQLNITKNRMEAIRNVTRQS